MQESFRRRRIPHVFRGCHLDSRICRDVFRILSHCAEFGACAPRCVAGTSSSFSGPSEQDIFSDSSGGAAALCGPSMDGGCGLGRTRSGGRDEGHPETVGCYTPEEGGQRLEIAIAELSVDDCPGVARAHLEGTPLVETLEACEVREVVFDEFRNVSPQRHCGEAVLSGSLDNLSVDFSSLLKELVLQDGVGEGKDGSSLENVAPFVPGEACPRVDAFKYGKEHQRRTLDGFLGHGTIVGEELPGELLRREPSGNTLPMGENYREPQLKVCDSFRPSTCDSGLKELSGCGKEIDTCMFQDNEMEEGEIPNEGEILSSSLDLKFQSAGKDDMPLDGSHLSGDSAGRGNATYIVGDPVATEISSVGDLIKGELGRTRHESKQSSTGMQLKPQNKKTDERMQKKKKSDETRKKRKGSEGTEEVKRKVRKKVDMPKEHSDNQPKDEGRERQMEAKNSLRCEISRSENLATGCSTLSEVSLKGTLVQGEEKLSNTEKNLEVKSEKRKRAPLTENRKEKKKIAKKRKRAETNSKLGIKRLKLEMLSKPKKVIPCSFYQKGRCQKGDSCKFSHDIIPDTKGTPCTFFARGICLKGDECPFDHELSKYPCHSYMSQGRCTRGDRCLFSHNIPDGEPSSSAPISIQKDLKMFPCQTQDSNLSTSIVYSSLKTTPACTKISVPKGPVLIDQTKQQPLKMPKGICFLSFSKKATVSTNKQSDDLNGKTRDPIQAQKKVEKITPSKLQKANENILNCVMERVPRTLESMGNELNSCSSVWNPSTMSVQNMEMKSCGSAQSPASENTTLNGSKDSITHASKILEDFLFSGID